MIPEVGGSSPLTHPHPKLFGSLVVGFVAENASDDRLFFISWFKTSLNSDPRCADTKCFGNRLESERNNPAKKRGLLWNFGIAHRFTSQSFTHPGLSPAPCRGCSCHVATVGIVSGF